MAFHLPRNAQIWLPGLARSWWASHGLRASRPPRRVWLMIGDHYEPYWGKVGSDVAQRRVEDWLRLWPAISDRNRDDSGAPAQYGFFYPEEEYDPRLLDQIASLCAAGTVDVEIHIHHDNDTPSRFVEVMGRFLETLHKRHGLLHKVDGQLRFGFIHGNWALDNSRHDGRWCGLNNELSLLRDLGCYADFTLPSVPETTQVSMVNQIYWAKDDPDRPKSHDSGVPLTPGGGIEGDLLIVPGPLSILWGQDGRWKPRVDTGELAGNAPPTRARVRLWLRFAPRVGDDVFIKLFTHGTQERNSRLLLEGGLDTCFSLLREETHRIGAQLFHATPWQFWRAIEAVRLRQDPVTAVRGLKTGSR